MIKVWSGVKFHESSFRNPCVMRILSIADKQSPAGYNPEVISACDGKHSVESKHYRGLAFDLCTIDFPFDRQVWAARMRETLGDEYFLLVENDHIHVQFNG